MRVPRSYAASLTSVRVNIDPITADRRHGRVEPRIVDRIVLHRVVEILDGVDGILASLRRVSFALLQQRHPTLRELRRAVLEAHAVAHRIILCGDLFTRGTKGAGCEHQSSSNDKIKPGLIYISVPIDRRR